MSEFIPPEDAVVEEKVTEQIDFIPPTDAKEDVVKVDVEKTKDPQSQTSTTDPENGESSSEDTSLESISIDKVKDNKPDFNKKKPSYFAAEDANGELIYFNNKKEYKEWVEGKKVDTKDKINIGRIFGRKYVGTRTKEGGLSGELGLDEIEVLDSNNKTLGNKEKARGKVKIVESVEIDKSIHSDKTSKYEGFDVIRYEKVELPESLYNSNSKLFDESSESKINIPGVDPKSYSRDKKRDYYIPVYLNKEGEEEFGEIKIMNSNLSDLASDQEIANNYLQGKYDKDPELKAKIQKRLDKEYKEDFVNENGDFIGIDKTTIPDGDQILLLTFDVVDNTFQADPAKFEPEKLKAIEQEAQLRLDLEEIQTNDPNNTDEINRLNSELEGVVDKIFNLNRSQVAATGNLTKYRKYSPFLSDHIKLLESDILTLEKKPIEERTKADIRKLDKKKEELEELSEKPKITKILKGFKVNKKTGKLELSSSQIVKNVFVNIIGGSFEYEDDKSASTRENTTLEAVELATNINDTFNNYNIAADIDGDYVIAYKNPSRNDNGSVDVYKTAINNGISEEKIKELARDNMRKSANQMNTTPTEKDLAKAAKELLKQNNFSASIEVDQVLMPGSDFNVDEVENFANFINDESTTFKYNEDVFEYQSKYSDTKQEKRNKKLQEELIRKSTGLQDNINKQNTIIRKQEFQGEKVQGQVEAMKVDYEDLNRRVDFHNTRLEDINQEVKDLEAYTKRKIANDPSKRNEYVDFYKKENENLRKDFDSEQKRRQKVIDKFENTYEESYDTVQSQLKVLNKLNYKQNKIVVSTQKALDDLNLLSAVSQQYDYLSKSKMDLAKDTYESFEGRGNTFLAVSKTFTDMLANISAGRAELLADVATAINEFGGLIPEEYGGLSDSKYEYQKRQIDSSKSSFMYDANAAAKQMAPKGIDENFYNKWSESSFGGTVQSLTQMVAASFGAPVTGLFGGFFMSSLHQQNVKMRDVKSSFISEYLENNPGSSRSEAKKELKKRIPPGFEYGVAYAQATAEGAMSWLGGKIIGGGGKVTSEFTKKLVNKALKSISGKVNARSIQVGIYKTLGESISKLVAKGTKISIVGIEELLEETTQMGVAGAGDSLFEDLTGVEFEGFNLFDKIKRGDKDLIHMATISFLSGAIGGSVNVLRNKTSLLTAEEKNLSLKERNDLDNFYYKLAEQSADADVLNSELAKNQEKFNTGAIDEETRDKNRKELEENYSIYSEIMKNPDINGRTIINVAALTRQRMNLEAKANSMNNNPSAAANIKENINEINTQIEEEVKDSNNKKLNSKKSETEVITESLQTVIDIKNAEENPDFKGDKAVVKVFNKENVQEIADEYNIPIESLIDEDGNYRSKGSYLPDLGIILIEETASEGTRFHEGSHVYLDLALNKEENKDVVFALADTMMAKMKELNPKAAAAVNKVLEEYKQDDNYSANEVAEEVMAFYVQLKKDGFFKENKSLLKQFTDQIQKLFRNIGFTSLVVDESNIDLILNDYIENVSSGKLSKKQSKILKGDFKFSNKIKEKGKKIRESKKYDKENNVKQLVPRKRTKNEDKDKKVETPVIAINEETNNETKLVASLDIKLDTKSMSNSFDSKITEDIVTNDDFKQSEAVVDAFNNINDNEQFNNYVNQLINRDNNLQSLPSEIKQDINRKIKENLSDRVIKNFKPVLDGNKRSLFSYIYGKADQRGLGGIAQKSLLDIKKEYATSVDSDARSIDKPTSEGQAFDIEDTGAEQDIINRIDSGEASAAPKSTFRKNLVLGDQKGLNNEQVKDFKKVSENVSNKLPDANAKNFRTKLDQLAGTELKSWVKDNILKGQDYKTFVKDNYNNIRDLDIKYLIDLDKGLMKQGKPRMFTKPNRRLTNQADIRKYRDSGRAYVENESQGVMLYDILNPGADATVDFFTKEKPSTVSNRKGKLAESLGRQMFKDALPEIRNKKGESDQTKAMSAKKTQKDPRLLFAKKLDGLDLDLDQKQKKSFEKKVVKILEKNPGVTLEEAIEYEAKAIGKSRGFAYENVIIRRLKELKIKGFVVSDQAGGNSVGIPDFAASIFGNSFDVEVKLEIAQYSSVSLIHRNQLTTLSKDKGYSFADRLTKDLIDKAKKPLAAYRKRAGELGADLKLYDRTGKLPLSIYTQLQEEGLQKAITQKAEFNQDIISELYQKKVPPTNYIQIKNKGLFFMGSNPLNLPIPEFKADVNVTLRVSRGLKTDLNGVEMTTMNLRILPDNLKNVSNSDYTLDNASSVSSLMKTEAVKMLEAKVPAKESNIKELSNKVVKFSKTETNEDIINYASTVDETLRLANSLDQPVKKIRVFDFDDTLATTKSDVLFTAPDGTEGKLNAEQFATQGAQLLEQGYVFDFSEFNKVTKGKPGPLLDIAKKIQDARGTQDVFVLTARSPAAQVAIKEFLDSQGLDIPLENITGLGDSTGAAKAKWMVNKAAEGYNDFYFADDAYQNVEAVRDVMSVIDVKSKVQQARVKESKKLSDEFNGLLEETTGIDSFKEYSAAKAKTIGSSKGNFKFFIPYSAEDYLGLIYPTLTKGKLGDTQMAWYKKNVLDLYTAAQENLSTARLNLMNDFKQLKKSLNVPKNLRKKNNSGFTNEQAVRVHLFTSMGYEVPGLSKRDLKELNDTVENDAKLKEFSNQILTITKGDGYAAPDQNWLVGTITTDLINLINTEKRSKYLSQWQENVDVIYSKENLNKLEVQYGTKYREALENILSRMKSGKNRMSSGSKLENRILDYINGSIGTVMFFNTRSALLQTISSINFVNWSFNNPLKAGAAFANQKQYWTDFKELMNSDYLLDRRNGLKINISESEIADAASTSKNKGKAALNWLLSKGFLPTQIADSFAIASGGATFFRNRINDLIKQGKTEAEAKKQAMIEFRQIAETSQQSSDPSKISSQQASNAGRIILAFANTPMQYARIQKRAIQDLINGRGDAKSNVSKIIYYGFVQNVIFNVLQQAVFALGFGDDDEDDPRVKAGKQKKYFNVANGMADSLLRGLGIGGAMVSVGKNFLLDIYERSGRDRPEYVDSVWKLTQFSPPISSKISKLKQAAWQFDSKKRRETIFDKGFALDNPAYEAAAKVVSATTNIPLDRVVYKLKNIEGALDEDNEAWQRLAMLGGWPKWQLETPKGRVEMTSEEKKEAKSNVKINNYKKAKGSTDYDTIKKLTSEQQVKMLKGLGFGDYTIKNAKSEDSKIKLIQSKNSGKKIEIDKEAIRKDKFKKLSKAEQVRKLDSLGLSKADINALKYEDDRVKKMLELMK